MNKYFQFEQDLKRRINKIPKKNKPKFMLDLMELIELAYGDDYEDFSF